jgi:hypothetical protein
MCADEKWNSNSAGEKILKKNKNKSTGEKREKRRS